MSDDLESMENMMAGSNKGPSPAAPILFAAPRESGDTLKAQALAGLPPEWRERLINDAAQAGVRHDNDVGWLLVGSVVNSAAAALAANAAAIEISDAIGKIQGQIYAGAVKAGNSVKGDVVAGIAATLKAGGDAILASIDVAAQAGSDKVAEGSKNLISKLDAAVEVKKNEGVSAFARAAAEAAVAAANTASATVLSENKVKLRRSALTMALIFIVYAGLGWAANSEYLSLTHQITPAPLVITPAGKPVCGILKNGERVCQIQNQ